MGGVVGCGRGGRENARRAVEGTLRDWGGNREGHDVHSEVRCGIELVSVQRLPTSDELPCRVSLLQHS